MTERYGIPYKGSKNQIAEWVIENLPPAENLYDLFCGGCAVTHRAMIAHKYKNYIINDIDGDLPKLFVDALNGKFNDYNQWISREMFEMLKDSDALVRYLWSFGNNGKNYLYSKEREKIKQAHSAEMYSETLEDCKANVGKLLSVIEDLVKTDVKHVGFTNVKGLLSKLDTSKDERESVKRYLHNALEESAYTQAELNRLLGTQMCSHYFGNSQWQLPPESHYLKLQQLLNLPLPYCELAKKIERYKKINSAMSCELFEYIGGLNRCDNIIRMKGLQAIAGTPNADKLRYYCGSYDKVKIEPNSVIYCDIPYVGTDDYVNSGFNHRDFYEWATHQEVPVFISEYYAPEELFTCVAQIEKTVLLQGGGGNKKIEKIFVPKNQKIPEYGQLKIF